MKKLLLLTTLISLSLSFSAFSKVKEFEIIIKNHQFFPENLEVPADEKIKLIVDNQDKTPEEFESHDLDREKLIAGGKKGIIYLRPMKEGVYKYFGEFNPKTAHGTITAKEKY